MDYKEQAEKQLRAVDFDKSKLPDISDIVIPNGDLNSRILAFLQIVGNPYLFRVGDVGVHVTFSGKNGESLQKKVSNLLLKSI